MCPCTPLQERRERHRQNYMHITIHTSQTWADTFISELNDTHVEAELRTRNIPPLVRLTRGLAGMVVVYAVSLSVRQQIPIKQVACACLRGNSPADW
jgi:hypothetical protein